jgi:anti-anti-sigma factor
MSRRRPGVELRLRREQRRGSVVLHASGDVDLSNVALLANNLATAETIAKPPAPVILDLCEVTFFGAVGLSTLLEHTRRCAHQRTPLRVVADQNAVLRPLQLTGLHDTLNLHQTLTHAMHTPV